MEKEFFEKTPFLNHYQAIKEFAKLFCEGFLKNSDLSYSVVCERKEDIISVRNQLFYEINLILNFDNNINSTLCGISMYTLDELARNFCATIASTTEKNILNEIINKQNINYKISVSINTSAISMRRAQVLRRNYC